jgi:DNA-3-methyladenine glycosylase II
MSREAAKTLREDPALEPLIEEYGPVSLDPAPDPFRRLVVSLLRQQVSMDAAAAIRERLFDRVEITPGGILDADPATLREAGLSEAKTEYVRHAARAFQEHGYDRAHFADVSDEAVLAELTEIRGIGPWTGKMFLLFALGRPDVFPVEDLGIRKGIWEVVDSDLSRADMHNRADRWRPYRSYASLYLWRAYEG